MNKDSKKGRIQFELTTEASQDACEIIVKSLNPDNDPNISMECADGKIKVQVRNLKIASLYNITDDILRCYETSKKIVDGSV